MTIGTPISQQRDRAPRQPRADGQRTRGAILRTAASLATVDGLEGLSIGNLAAATGWVGDANGSLYWYIDHGYAVASSSLNSFGTSTDAVVSAESAYKVKEQFIKEFGVPEFTVSPNGIVAASETGWKSLIGS